MRIFILGAGAMGSVAADDLARDPEVEEVIVGDLSQERAEATVSRLPKGKARAVVVDAKDEEALAMALRGVDAVANAAWYSLNLAVMNAALQAKIHYADLGGLFHMTRRQLELDSAFREISRTAILGIGAAPGVANLMARYAAGRLEGVREIHFYTGSRSLDSKEGAFPFSVRTMLDEIALPPVIWSQGEYRVLPPLSGEEEVLFPPPIGPLKGHLTMHSEMATLPYTIPGVEEVDFRICWPEGLVAKLKFLSDLGLTSTKPVVWNGVEVIPRDFLNNFLPAPAMEPSGAEIVGSMMCAVRGEKDGQAVEMTLYTLRQENRESRYTLVGEGTGIPLALACRLLARGEIKATGALPPESALDAERFFKGLAAKGLKVRLRTEEILG